MQFPTKHITLKHLLINSRKQIGLKFSSDNILDSLVNNLSDVKWSDDYRMYYLLNTKSNLDAVFSKFRGIAWINCNHFFPDRPINK